MSAAHQPESYGDTFADVYDKWYSTLTDDDFVEAFARRLPTRPVRILELGVGTGRLAIKIRQRRGDIQDEFVGIDASIKMLAQAHHNRIDAFVHLECMDFSTTLPPGPFDAVFIGYNTLFNLPSSAAIGSCLTLISSVLAGDGFFMCDLVVPSGEDHGEHSVQRIMANGDIVTSVSQHDSTAQTISGSFTHTTGNETTTRPWQVRYVLPHQLDDLADSAGLRLETRFEDGEGHVFTSDSPRHISTYILR